MDKFEFQRAQDEWMLFDMAIRLDAAIRVYKERNGMVNLDVYLDKMDEELVRISLFYIFITETRITGYRVHDVCPLSGGRAGPTLPPHHQLSRPTLGRNTGQRTILQHHPTRSHRYQVQGGNVSERLQRVLSGGSHGFRCATDCSRGPVVAEARRPR